MGGKSRKSGRVSPQLIERLKRESQLRKLGNRATAPQEAPKESRRGLL
jgi:hypothetical protein